MKQQAAGRNAKNQTNRTNREKWAFAGARGATSLWASRSATRHRSFRFSNLVDFREYAAPEFTSAKPASNRSNKTRLTPGQRQLKTESAERLGHIRERGYGW